MQVSRQDTYDQTIARRNREVTSVWGWSDQTVFYTSSKANADHYPDDCAPEMTSDQTIPAGSDL